MNNMYANQQSTLGVRELFDVIWDNEPGTEEDVINTLTNDFVKSLTKEDFIYLIHQLSNRLYVKSLQHLSLNLNIDIYEIMETGMNKDITKLPEYYSMIGNYLNRLSNFNKLGKLSKIQIDDLIQKQTVFGLSYALTHNLFEVTEDFIDAAKKQHELTNSSASLTIYNLLKQIYKDNIESGSIKEAEQYRSNFCNIDKMKLTRKRKREIKETLTAALIFKSISIILPYFRVMPTTFDKRFLVDDFDPEYRTSYATMDQSNYLGGQSSIFFKDKIDYILDKNWLVKNNMYILNLSKEDKFTVYGYTHNGDQIANGLLRGQVKEVAYFAKYPSTNALARYQPLFFPLRKILAVNDYGIDRNLLKLFLSSNLLISYKAFTQTLRSDIPDEAFIAAAKMYVQDLQRIINNSPPVNEDMILYRGSKTLYYSTTNRETFKTNTFMSTTFDISTAMQFAGRDCCTKKLILKPGARALFIDCITQHPDEREILLPLNTEFKIISHEIKTYYRIDNDQTLNFVRFPSEKDRIIHNFCKNPEKRYMTVTTMQQI